MSRSRRLVVAFAIVMSLLAVTAMPVSASHGPAIVSEHDTASDFNQGTLTNTTAVGSGASATVEGNQTVTVTFDYTGSEQTWVVPEGIDSIHVELHGAGTSSADGGYVEGDLDVTPGETLRLYVGQGRSGQNAGGWNGGGDGGSTTDSTGEGGAGATDIRQGGSTLSDRVAVAGGAGGSGDADAADAAAGNGGAGGADTGEDGQDSGQVGDQSASGGGGGTQSAGGTSPGGTDGGSGSGGNGDSDAPSDFEEASGGGGGAGYFGGGGGGAEASNNDAAAGGGGAGSNYDDGLSSVDANQRGAGNSGHGQIVITYKAINTSGTYLNEHTVEGSVGGEVNLTELNNGTATVTWEGWDGSSWTQLAQTTGITSSGVYSDTWSEFTTTDTVRVNVTVVNDTGSDPATFEVESDGVEADTVEPGVDNSSASPTGTLSTATPTLEIDINDSDFAKAHGDEVTVTFRTNQSGVVGTDTLTSNGTASYTLTDSEALTGGDHTWNATAEDDYGHSNTSQDFTVTTPGELIIRDEQNASRLIDDAQVNITAYYSGQIIRRTSSDATIDLSGFPVDEPIIVRLQADGYHTRTIVIEDIFDQNSAYMLNESVSSHEVRFDMRDPTGLYDRADTVLFVERDINLSDTIDWRTVAGDEFGIQGVPVDLVADERYRLRIKNLETGTTATLGSFTVIQSETVTLTPGEATLEFENINRSYTWEARENESAQKIIVEYEDTKGLTESVKITIHERFNESNVLVDNQTFTGSNSIVFEQPLTNDEVNKTWTLELYVDRGDGFEHFREPIGSGPRDLIPAELDGVWRSSAGVVILLISSLAYSELNRGVGTVATALTGGLLWFIGLLSTVAIGPAVAAAIVVSVAYQYRTGANA